MQTVDEAQQDNWWDWNVDWTGWDDWSWPEGETDEADESGEVDAVGKGKIKGKNGKCYNCYQPGHVAANCSNPTVCSQCGGKGHTG